MLKAKSTAAANGDHVGVVRYGLQSMYILLWVRLPCSLACLHPQTHFWQGSLPSKRLHM